MNRRVIGKMPGKEEEEEEEKGIDYRDGEGCVCKEVGNVGPLINLVDARFLAGGFRI